jgi:hypothetical protein
MISDLLMIQILTVVSFIIGLIIRYTFMSKCSEVNFCGCCRIKRDIAREQTIKGNDIEANQPVSPSRERKEETSISIVK